jgi:DtxR family transcriptional regulator, Mn-dependent transcriptional regulator
MTEKTISSSMEDYLKAIFELGEKDVSTQDLAKHLGVSAASVTGMIKKLSELKLIDYERYYGVKLTKAGRLIALETVRHHRLIETYLMQALGYQWHQVHDEAEKLEHHISEDFEDRIAEMLGHPTHDPHGDPIPQRDGSIPDSIGQPLSAFELGQVKITRITNQQPDILQYLDNQHLRPGETLQILEKAPFNGPLTLSSRQKPFAIAFELAQQIYAVTNE